MCSRKLESQAKVHPDAWRSDTRSFENFLHNEIPNLNTQSECLLVDSFMHLKNTNHEVLLQLYDTIGLITSHQETGRYIQTTGTSIGAFGTVAMVAGFCAAPFTGGISTFLSASGFVTTLTSAITGIGVEAFKRSKTKSFINDVTALQVKQNRAVERLNMHFDLLNETVRILRSITAVTEEVAVSSALSVFRNGPARAMVRQSMVQQLSPAQIAALAKNVMPFVIPAMNFIASSTMRRTGKVLLQNSATSIGSAARHVSSFTLTNLRAAPALLRSGTKISSTGKLILKGVGAAAGVVFTAVDIALLYKEWNTEHPLIKQIENIADVLIKEISMCNEMVNLLIANSETELSEDDSS